MPQILWTVRDVKRAVGVPVTGGDGDIFGVSIDTRTLQPGDLFIALKNERDGHDFVASAAEKGAGAVLVERAFPDLSVPQIVVPDTFTALQALGVAQRDWVYAKRVAITGSSGKTTTKELMAAALGGVHKSEGSYNNHWGVPLTLARMPRESKYGVFEIGTNHPGEILPLAQMVKPHVAVVTNIHLAHIGMFADVQDLAVEKLSIAQGMAPGGVLVTSDEVYEQFPAYFDKKPMLFSMTSGKGDVCLEASVPSVHGQSIVADVAGEIVSFQLRIPGDHAAADALAVLAAAKALGFDVKAAAAGMENVAPPHGRGVVFDVGGVYVLDESYNANPASMAAILKAFKARPVGGKRYAILGDMRELGEGSAAYHAGLAPFCEGLDGVVTVGTEMKALHDALPSELRMGHFEDQSAVNLERLVNQLEAGDMVMVKGSKGSLYAHGFVPRLLKVLEQRKDAARAAV